jgi:hypothetical protein
VPNPIFTDLNPKDDDSMIRDPGLVFFAGIVGVPWQDIARDPADLTKGFKNADELNWSVEGFSSTWDIILGDPAHYIPPVDPFMVESVDPRFGTNPITGDPIVPPDGAPNAINGTEWDTQWSDLQYACIFDLPPGAERDCSIPGQAGCECDASSDNPLCCKANDPDPRCNGAPATLQVRAKAYPGIRELSLIRSLGSQGIVGSVCPAQLDHPGRADFGYRPAIGAIIDRLGREACGGCLPNQLPVDGEGRVDCLMIEARSSNGACNCQMPGRQEVRAGFEQVVTAIEADPLAGPSGWDCYCEVVQLDGEELQACQYTVEEPVLLNGQPVDGWCYVDLGAASGPIGHPDIVADCPVTEKRDFRFVGKGEPLPGATVFTTCDVER